MKRRILKTRMTVMVAFMLMQFYSCENNNRKIIKTDEIPQIVVVSKVDKNQGINEIPYSGTIVESESYPLSFSVVGTVSRVLVSEGDIINKGQLLAELNEESYTHAYEMTTASLKQAEDAYKRLKPMYDNGNLQEIKFVEVETGLQQAKSANYISKKNLEDCKLYSPISGVVGKKSIEVGMSAIPNMISISIIKIEKVYARVPISENDIASIKKGDKATIKIAALNDNIYEGIIEEIGVIADPIAHTYPIKIGISNSNKQIKPGMICNVIISRSKNEQSELTVPSRAVLIDENGRNFVFIVNQNKAIRKYVTIGKPLRNEIEVINVLNQGEQVVVSGQHKLVNNSLIQIR